ncbi:unnamed protein product [Camellia sinensis]
MEDCSNSNFVVFQLGNFSYIQKGCLTKIALENWSKAGGGERLKKPFSLDLVKEIYNMELLVKDVRKPVPLQRVMILEVS